MEGETNPLGVFGGGRNNNVLFYASESQSVMKHTNIFNYSIFMFQILLRKLAL